jgi:hypothetical protein
MYYLFLSKVVVVCDWVTRTLHISRLTSVLPNDDIWSQRAIIPSCMSVTIFFIWRHQCRIIVIRN